MNREKIRNVLGFWYHQSLFAPLAPPSAYTGAGPDEPLPWEDDAAGERSGGPKKIYRLYGGLAAAEDLLQQLGPTDQEASYGEEEKTCLYTLDLDQRGRYLPGSFQLAFFPWLIGRLAEGKAEADALDPELCRELSAELNEELSLSDPQFTKSMIEALNRSLEEVLTGENMHCFDTHFYLLTEAADLKEDTERQLLQEDLKKAAEDIAPGDSLGKYLDGLNRRALLKPADLYAPERWKPYYKPDAYPEAAWPGIKEPQLAEQHIVNRIFAEKNEEKIEFFQAPQTSGREHVIANTAAGEVYKRAAFLAGLSKPADAFTMRRFRYPPNDYSGNYYVPFYELGQSALVLSAEDEATLKKLARNLADPTFVNRSHSYTDSFDLQRHEEIYFSKTAQAFLPWPAWGLTAVYLEDEEDLLRLVRKLGEVLDPKAAVWKKYADSENRLLSWGEAKLRFLRLEDKLKVKAESLQQIYRQSEELAAAETERDALEEKLQQLEKQTAEERQEHDQLISYHEMCKEHFEGRKADEVSYKESMHGFRKWIYKIFKAGPYAGGIESLAAKTRESENTLRQAEALLSENERFLRDSEVKTELLRKQLNLKEKQLEERRPSAELMRAALGENYADHRFVKSLDTAEAQSVCPWMDHELAALRERMFRASLNLLKSFCVHSNEIRQNLRRLEIMLEGRFSLLDQEDALPHLLHSVSLVIPLLVVSRRFWQRLSRFTAKNNAGTLIYLDPERNRPEELVGAFRRAGKAFCFGDSLLLPQNGRAENAADRALREAFALPAVYGSSREATDAYLTGAQEEIFAFGKTEVPFPLRFNSLQSKLIHDLDNRLFLQGIWLSEAEEAADLPDDFLEKSSWLDVGGSCEPDSEFVCLQADLLTDMLTSYAAEHNKLPDLSIACFYPSVYKGLKDYAASQWLRRDSFFSELLAADEIKAWFAEHVFLLSEWDGRMRDELVFLPGADEETSREKRDLAAGDRRVLHTLLSAVRRKMLFIANAAVWASEPPFDRFYAALNHEDSPAEMNKKTLVFIRAGKSLQDEAGRLAGKSDTKLSPEGRRDLLRLRRKADLYPETDRCYSSSLVRGRETMEILFPEAGDKIEKSVLNEAALGILEDSEINDENTRILLNYWNEGEDIHPDTESKAALLERARTAVKELLDELERVSLSSAAVITHQYFMTTYYNSIAGTPLDKDVSFCCGGGFTVEYYRLGRSWKPGRLELLPYNTAGSEEECRRKLDELCPLPKEQKEAPEEEPETEKAAEEIPSEGGELSENEISAEARPAADTVPDGGVPPADAVPEASAVPSADTGSAADEAAAGPGDSAGKAAAESDAAARDVKAEENSLSAENSAEKAAAEEQKEQG